MKTSIQIAFLLIASAIFVGCASQTTQTASTDLLPQPKPSYDEKIKTVGVDKVTSTNCPDASAKWQSADWKTMVGMGNSCVKAQSWLKVESIGRTLASHAQKTPWGAYFLALAADSRHDYARALWMLELALKKDPKEGLFHFELARIYWDLKQDQDAIAHLKTAAELSPELTQAQSLMGQLAFERHDYSSAESYLKKALASDSKHLPSLLILASLKLNSKSWDEAETYLSQAVSADPRSAKVRLKLAQLQEEHLKKLPDALNSYKQLKSLAAQRKLDDTVQVNLDEKIQVLEKSLVQTTKSGALTERSPSAEKRVAQ